MTAAPRRLISDREGRSERYATLTNTPGTAARPPEELKMAASIAEICQKLFPDPPDVGGTLINGDPNRTGPIQQVDRTYRIEVFRGRNIRIDRVEVLGDCLIERYREQMPIGHRIVAPRLISKRSGSVEKLVSPLHRVGF